MEEVKQAVEAKAETKEEKRARRRAERAARRAKKKEEGGFWKDFKAFITRGNVIDLLRDNAAGGEREKGAEKVSDGKTEKE